VKCPTVKNVVVFRRSGSAVTMQPAGCVWHDAMEKAGAQCPAEWMDAEDRSICSTPPAQRANEGIAAHHAATRCRLSDQQIHLRSEGRRRVLGTADIGWVTGHSYIVYGPLQQWRDRVIYEGAPNWPENDRFWKIIDAHKVTVFYTAPTAIRAFTKWGIHGSRSTRSPRCAARNGGRAINPILDVVSPHDRQGALPDRRHLLADRDGCDHDRADPGPVRPSQFIAIRISPIFEEWLP